MPRPKFEEQWRQRFIQRGTVCQDDADIAGWTRSGLEARLRNFQRLWPGDVPGALWLDVGCGAGSYTRYLAEQGVTPIGMDYSLPSVQKARERSSAAMTWAVGDVTQLAIRPASLDGVLCFGVMQALSRPEQAVAEMVGSVRDGGEVWVDALNRDCLFTRIKRVVARLRRRPLGLRYDTPGELSSWMRRHGAREVEIHWIPILPARLQRLQPWVESGSFRALLSRVPVLGSLLSHAVLIRARL
ncbi:hypothetical protein CKO35_05500 [Ectothiorhodospira shaposhnikovii]|uniref:class I SAM-dependent methyltransferase n=1 Tax=Ectothiorhodospira shaposhnikovii TaxID=1054 RepID=UPI001907D150|nr:class I SAM-dependent methyltransferase [Ectothiorhodospira shaposhnikovii]MBK1672763.1 hypothetical protein [Ectothiorhodospira shaposhnikovii]